MASSELITCFLSMKGMRFPLHIILTALTLYFLIIHLTKSRSSNSAYTLINESKNCGESTCFITDRFTLV